jgi:hypothetical protein
VRLRRLDRKRFDTMVIIIMGLIWKQRNSVFRSGREQCGIGQLIDHIHDEFKIWKSMGAGGSAHPGRE